MHFIGEMGAVPPGVFLSPSLAALLHCSSQHSCLPRGLCFPVQAVGEEEDAKRKESQAERLEEVRGRGCAATLLCSVYHLGACCSPLNSPRIRSNCMTLNRLT